MRLNVKHSSKLSKTDKQKKANKEKKSKGPKLLKNYRDLSEPKFDKASVNFTSMTYGVIEHCDLKSVKLENNIITVDGWVELLILMLYNVISNHPNNFKDILANYEITNMFLCVDNVYGKYTFEQKQYKVYNIYDTGYYLELIEDSEIIFEALLALTKSMNIVFTEIEFNVCNKLLNALNTDFKHVLNNEIIVGIMDVPEYLVGGNHLISVEFLDETIFAHRLDILLVAFCNKLYDTYGIVGLKSLSSSDSTGICEITDDDITNEHIVRIKESNIGIYTDGDNLEILQFIINSMLKLGLSIDDIKFKYRQLKLDGTKKEWEVD